MSRPHTSKAAAKRRQERALVAVDKMAVILGDGAAAVFAKASREFRARAMAAAPAALVASAATLAVDDLPTPQVATAGADAVLTPQMNLSWIWDGALWEQVLTDAEEFLTSFVVEELDIEFGIKVLAEQPLVQGLTRRHVDEIASWGDELRATVGRVVDKGHREMQSVRDVAKALVDAGVGSEHRAMLIARTETIAASNGATYIGATAVAEPGDRKRWLSSRDGRVRPDHRDADGQEVPLNEAFEVGGEKGDYPGSPQFGPAQRALCRCSWRVIYAD